MTSLRRIRRRLFLAQPAVAVALIAAAIGCGQVETRPAESQERLCNACGTTDATYQGIPVFDNSGCAGNNFYTKDGVNYDSTGELTGLEYQCVEFAQRYMRFQWGVTPANWGGNAIDLCNTHPTSNTVITNNPVAGDLIILPQNAGGSAWAITAYGHVAVVTSNPDASGNMNTVSQNWGTGFCSTQPQKTWNKTDITCYAPGCTNGRNGCFIHATSNGAAPPSTVGQQAHGPMAVNHFQGYDGAVDVALFSSSAGVPQHVFQTNHQDPNGGYNAPASLGSATGFRVGGSTTMQVARNQSGGTLEVFAREDAFGNVWHLWQSTTGAWNSWVKVAPNSPHVPAGGGSPAVGFNASTNHLQVFFIDVSGALYTSRQCTSGSSGCDSDGWTFWTSLGGNLASSPAVGTNANGGLELMARNASGWSVAHNYQTSPGSDTWSGFSTISAGIGAVPDNGHGSPAVALNKGTGKLEVFANASSGHLVHSWQCSGTGCNSGWSNWGDLSAPSGGSFQGTPNVVANSGDGHLEVFNNENNSHNIYHVYQTTAGGAWGTWTLLGSGTIPQGYGFTGSIVDSTGILQLMFVDWSSNLWTIHACNSSTTPCNGGWSTWQQLQSGFLPFYY